MKRKVAEECTARFRGDPHAPLIVQEQQRDSLKTNLRLALPHIALVGVCVLYILGGASLFYSIESAEEFRMRQEAETEMNENFERILDVLHEEKKKGNETSFVQLARTLLDNSTQFRFSLFQKRYSPHPLWSFPNALFFCVSTITTIGYGNLVPTTFEARLCCIVYGLFGIPLMLIAIADVGKFLGEGLRYIGGEKALSARVLMVLLTGYLLLGAFMLSRYENWTYGEAVYWSFITVTSIGFGDVVAERSSLLGVTIVYLLVGLALTSIAVDCLVSAYIQRVHYFGRSTFSDLKRFRQILKAKLEAAQAMGTQNRMRRRTAICYGALPPIAYRPREFHRMWYIDRSPPLLDDGSTDDSEIVGL